MEKWGLRLYIISGSVADGETFVRIVHQNIPLLLLPLTLSADFLLGLLDEGLVVPQVGQYVLGEVILHDRKSRYDGVYFLRGGLLGHHSEAVLLLVGRLAKLAQSIGRLSYVQFGCFAATSFVGKHLSPFEFLLETVLVETF